MRLCPVPIYSATLTATPGGAAGNFHTLALMRRMIDAGAVDPRVMSAAHSIIWLQPERDELAEACALYEYVRDCVRYVRDVAGVETLCDPAMTLQRQVGDCDDQTVLMCALLESCGYPTRLIMAGYHGSDFEHVYAQVFTGGDWITADPIERVQCFGWEAPGATVRHVEARSWR